MSNFKMPPREKVHEALSAIADNRVIINDNSAIVTSSNYSKEYIVNWEGNVYSSNDNATFWKGYPGYPIIAVLLIKGKIKYDKNIKDYFKNINWKAINTKYKNNYAKAVESVYQEFKEKGIDVDYIDKEVDKIYDSLKDMNVVVKRSKVFPPK